MKLIMTTRQNEQPALPSFTSDGEVDAQTAFARLKNYIESSQIVPEIKLQDITESLQQRKINHQQYKELLATLQQQQYEQLETFIKTDALGHPSVAITDEAEADIPQTYAEWIAMRLEAGLISTEQARQLQMLIDERDHQPETTTAKTSEN